ncbi:hypothetical protein M427DRAFT_96902 [Gonapodya prolifera JEL478]|uniref:Rap-GAP domain-containing protein n=1 Tax=Gonapodya prolifera (strain JEL478) TaxID=1344416 RepID=A0A139AM17_GONPJ|nr:hypothetical protein M427DRAFT_96902 [Gonapodya prolifera JEL478]|eukprot:KXS17553.1 hypothetical protein M427DRAFT_96902 [Gonapodya prolifera JEL478]
MDKLAVQLNFLRVFEHSRLGLQRLRTVLCDSILNDQLAPNLKLPKTVRKADLYVRAYRLLAGLIPYAKQSFSKSDQDEIVGAFQLGLTKWTQTARPCTHALLLCMYELPLSMVKHLAGTLDRMGRIMSTTAIAVHILEFLVSLIKTPNLWANFVEADYQRVFAIALRESIHPHPRETANASQSHFSPVAQNALAQYVIFLAYHTITLWFSSIRLSDRRKFVPYILRNLALANGTSRPIDERIEVCVDMLMRFSFANAEPKPQKSLVTRVMFDDAPAGQVLTKTWLQGNALLTIRVLKSSCWAEISIRRPTGTTVFLSRLENKFRGEDIDVVSVASIFMTGIEAPASNIAEDIQATPLHRHGRVGSDSNITSAASNTETTGGSESLRRSRTNPSSGRPFIRSTLTDGATKSSETTDGPVSSDSNEVRLLPDNAATSRALSVMDLTPLMDHFNVGVVYVGPGQTTEVEILQNTGGSAAYNEFLAGLGKFVKLKGRKDIYAGGLNTDDDIDGSEAVLWNEGGGQVIFHCATLMPNYEHDPNCTAKKRHIGNDFVLIVWNESGRPFGFRTIPSQFNFINIIIEPVDARYSSGTEGSRRTPDNTYFRLMTQRREDMPEFGPVSEPKLVSAISIPALVRHLAITADVFSQLFQKQGDGTTLEEWVSNWRTRLRDIKRVREQSQPGHTVPSRQGSVANVVSPSQLPNTSSGAGPRGLYNGQSQMDQLDVVLDFTRNT